MSTPMVRRAEPSATAPTLTVGVDPLPTTCAHCGSTSLMAEHPDGLARIGSVTCLLCSRLQAWLQPRVMLAPLETPLGEIKKPRRGRPFGSTAHGPRPRVTPDDVLHALDTDTLSLRQLARRLGYSDTQKPTAVIAGLDELEMRGLVETTGITIVDKLGRPQSMTGYRGAL